MRLLLLFAVTLCFQPFAQAQKKGSQDYYMVRIYHCADLQQIQRIEAYAGKQLVPFLHKNGIQHVGIFTPVDNDTLRDKKLFIWIPFSDLGQIEKVEKQFESNDPWGTNPLIHLDSAGGQPPYARIEVSLSSAFRDMTHYDAKTSFKKSPDNIYEYRSYESSTEALHLGKVHMFNEGGEVTLFKRLDFNALFYARVIAGARMPNLIYMTRFENMEQRNTHWKAFGESPEWKNISSMPKYQGNVSRNETIFLKASAYSDL